MTTGYTPAWPGAGGWTSFEWDVPETYNIAAAALDDADEDATALCHVDEADAVHEFTYGELDRGADALAAALADAGVERGDRVGVCLPQCPETLLAHLAAYRLGAVVVPLSMLLGREALTYSIEHADCSALVIDRQRRDDLADAAVPDAVSPTVVVEPGADDYGGPERHLCGFSSATVDEGSSSDDEGTASDDEGANTAGGTTRDPGDAPFPFPVDPGGTVDPVDTAPDELALILYTSGTTGHPKGVAQAHRYLIGSLPGYQCWFQLFDPASAAAARIWTPAEWAWAGALFDVVFPTLSLGGTVVSRCRRSGFDPDRALELIDEQGVTHGFVPPTALARIREAGSIDEHDLSALSVLQCGGEKLSPALLEWAESELDVTINEAYGLTEANALVGNCQEAFPVRPGSMGKPYPGHEIAILDDEGEPLPPGEVGEIAVRTPDPVVFLEYWDDPEATEEKYRGDWLLTGDAAERDEDGYFWHHGRTDDLIITSGYRVSPLEVEDALTNADAVADAVAGGVPDEQRGQRVKAYVVLREGVDPSAELRDRLRKQVRDDVGAHKVPREIEFIDRVPETRSGKADRSALFSDG